MSWIDFIQGMYFFGGVKMSDTEYMKLAIKLAKKGAGYVNPNPMVGAVIVKDNRIIGQGYHEIFGGLHAERNALKNCRESPVGATLYVTLEPCCHYGKTPPCTEAIIKSGITRVTVWIHLTPASWLNFTRYGTFAHIFEGKPESKRYEWTIAHVKAILKSEVYIGNSVHNRQSTVSFKSKKKVRKPESEWFRVENTHEPIIDKEVFYRVQEQIKSRRRQTKEKATPIFAGLVKCADCGWSMRFGTNKANKTPYSYYACSYYGQFGKGNCSMHYIRYDVLYQAVLERLQYWAKAVQQDEEKVLNKIQKVGNAERIREKKKKASTLKKAENRQNEIDRLFAKMYEDRACEKITERNFIMLSGKYQKEQIELEQQITNLREELSKMEQDMIGAEKWIELIKEYSVPKELTAPLLNAMIEKILIHEATTNEENERIQEIEIYYRFIGKVD